MTARAPEPAQRDAALPERTCVGCRNRAVKSSLLRLVAVTRDDAATGDDILPDPQARLPGRGAYLHPSADCLELARRRRALPRALRVPGPVSERSWEIVKEYLSESRSRS